MTRRSILTCWGGERCPAERFYLYEAMRLRDDCEAGKLTVAEYEQWMESYFPNRKKPKDKNAEK